MELDLLQKLKVPTIYDLVYFNSKALYIYCAKSGTCLVLLTVISVTTSFTMLLRVIKSYLN